VPVGHLITTVHASDADVNSAALTWSITAGNDSGLFSIDSATGAITVSSSLDAETAINHQLTVSVSDGTLTSDDALVEVNVGDVNEHSPTTPADADSTLNSVAASAAIGTPVGITVISDDLDVSDTVTLTLIGNPGGRFALDPVTGDVTTAVSLVNDEGTTHTITVQSESSDGRIVTNTFDITVTGPLSNISDADVSADGFDENAPVGTTVGVTVSAVDPDSTDTITYTLSDNALGRFTIDSVTGVVSTTVAFDAEVESQVEITAVATSSDGSSLSQTYTLSINDVNESVPTLAGHSVSLIENLPNGSVVGSLVVVDTDSTFVAQKWTIVQGNDDGIFAIDPTTGIVTIVDNKPFDAELSQAHTLTITVSDGDFTSASAEMTITVVDVDEYDASVVTDADPILNAVSESAPVGTSVGLIGFSTDKDVTDFITYSIADDTGHFAIDATTGEVTTAIDLTGEAGFDIEVNIVATSSDGSVENTIFTVAVTGDVGVLTDGNTSANVVDENAAIGTFVGLHANAVDPDTSDTVTYSLSNNANGQFAINPTTGVVVTAAELDAETSTSWVISVLATSTDGTQSSDVFTINVNDVNEALPTIVPVTVSIPENSGNGTTVATLSASDPDVSAVIGGWTIAGGNDLGGFAIDPLSGEITVADASVIDAESSLVHTLIVTVSDGEMVSTPVEITVNITDVNEYGVDPLTDLDISDNTVSSNAAIGSTVGVVANAVDQDASDSVSYSLLNSGTEFTIDPTTGVVTTSSSLVGLEGTTYMLSIQATSSSGSVDVVIWDVAITGDVGSVTDANSGANSVDENSAIGTSVGIQAAAVDPDAADSVSFSLLNTTNNSFAIDSSTGEVVTIEVLDAEVQSSYSITVVATSSDGSTSSQVFSIDVNDLNESAPVASPIEVSIAENPAAGELVATLSATDVDVSDVVGNWTIVSGNSSNAFALDATTGELTINDGSLFDAEISTLHTLEVTVSDGQFTSIPVTITINVTDVNEFNVSAVTDSDPSANTMPADAPAGTSVGIVAVASDLDVSDTVTYSVVDDIHFTVDPITGEVTNIRDLGWHAGHIHEVVVIATSSDGSTSEFTWDITLTTPIQAVTDSDISINSVDENQPIGTSVGIQANAIDLDSFDTVTYSLIDDAGGSFSINPSTGEVVTATVFDAEQTTSLDITVLATSTDGTQASKDFTIAIGDVNEGAPVFLAPSIEFSLPEDVPNGSTLGNFSGQASDSDVSATIGNWTITSGNDSGAFALDSATGILTVVDTNLIDAESTPSITLTITASDGELTSAPLPITMTLIDVNEHAVSPINGVSPGITAVPSTTPTGTTILSGVSAADNDVSDSVTFNLVGNPSEYDINVLTGEITVVAPLTALEGTTQTLVIQAVSTDGSTSEANFEIAITGVIGNTTDIDASANTVDENQAIGTAVGIQANAVDPDSSDSVEYSLSNDAGGAFAIDPVTGEIVTAKELDYEGTSSHTISVVSTSSDGTTSTSSFVIDVSDVNEAAPVVDPISVSVAEDANANTVLATLSASDADTADVLQQWNIIGGNASGAFAIDPVTGELVVADPTALDAETTGTYQLMVTVSDGELTSTPVAINVTVTDVNEFGASLPIDADAASNEVAAVSAVGTSVGVTASSDDLDVSDTVNYSLVNSTGEFSIDPITGEVVTAMDLTALAGSVQQVQIQAESSDGSISVGTFDITVTSGIGSLVDTDTTVNSVDENMPLGASVGIDVNAIDPDASDVVTYALIDDANGAFSIDPDSGIVITTIALDAETVQSHSITVLASSTDGSQSTETFVIDINNINEHAPVIDPLTLSLSEDIEVNTQVATLTAADSDLNGSATIGQWTIVSGNESGAFAIDSDTGVLSIADPTALDAETIQSMDLIVTVSDGSLVSAPATITINVTDANEFDASAPMDSDAAINQIGETAATGTGAGLTITAEDLDLTDTVSLSLIDDASGRFVLDPLTGEVVSARPLVGDGGTTFSIVVEAESSDGSVAVQQFTIDVTGEIQAVSDMDATDNLVSENAPAGTAVGISVQAIDPDASDTVTYGLSNSANGLFEIDTQSGVVTTIQGLDAETAQSHEIEVVATSTDGSTSTKGFTILVGDVNEFQPTILPAGNLTVTEGSSGIVITTLTAEDDDVNPVIGEWNIDEGNDAGHFEIDPITGELSISADADIDYETTSSYDLTVTLSHEGVVSEPALISIQVTNVNESPTIVDTSFETDSDFTGSIGQLEVVDPDTGDTHVFEIQGAVPAGLTVNEFGELNQTGEIEAGTLFLPVIVTDQSGASDTAVISLTVVNTTPEPAPEVSAAIPVEEAPEPFVETVSLTSIESPNNGSTATPAAVTFAPVTEITESEAEEPEAETAISSAVSESQSAGNAEELDASSGEESVISTTASSAETVIGGVTFSREDGALDLQSMNPEERMALRLSGNLNDPTQGLAGLDLGNNRRLVLDLLASSAEEAQQELHSLGSLFVSPNIGLSFSPQLINALQGVSDDLAENAAEDEDLLEFRVSSITFVSGALTLGFVTWLLQSGSLVATAVTTAPLWQSLDPVPVLVNRNLEADD